MPQFLLAHAAKVVLLALLAGLLWRGRARQCRAFALYVVAVLAGNLLVSLWPSRFWNADVWLLKQWVYDALKLAVVAELAWQALSRFPRAAGTGRPAIMALLAVGTLAIAPLSPASPHIVIREWQPRVATALWVLAAAVLIVLWYQVRTAQPWQRAITLGFVVLLSFVVLYRLLLVRQGGTLLGPSGIVDALVSLGIFAFWTWAAWRGEGARGLAPAS